MGTRVQTPGEIERLLGGTDVALLLDTGQLTAAGGEPVQALRDRTARVRRVHLEDVSQAVIANARDRDDARRNGAFCELGTRDVDLLGFFAALDGYDGWVVVEQDWFPADGEDTAAHVAAEVRNRDRLRGCLGI